MIHVFQILRDIRTIDIYWPEDGADTLAFDEELSVSSVLNVLSVII